MKDKEKNDNHKFLEEECYVCKKRNTIKHNFYVKLCIDCGEISYEKRHQKANLRGFSALISGARIKIGYETSLMLLRNGAKVLTTTRFPNDAIKRYSQENDYDQWRDRLFIYGIDFRQLSAVEVLIEYIKDEFRDINIIINNAAQTLRRPPMFYKHLIDDELKLKNDVDNKRLRLNIAGNILRINDNEISNLFIPTCNIKNLIPAQLTQIPLLPEDQIMNSMYFPDDKFDNNGQQEDRRPQNSWSMRLHEVSLVELIEVFYINTVTPFLFNSKLREILSEKKAPSFIINVSAMEGNFSKEDKSMKHPHTNMAKAALNMMTRTSATDYAEDLIYMNSVDVGYITNERPFPLDLKKEDREFKMPLDEIDGAARICDPIFQGVNHGKYIFGEFLKNFNPYSW